MATFLQNRSLMSGDGPHNDFNATHSNNPHAISLTDVRRLNGNTSIDNSPLQVFVRAKKKINDIYAEIEDYVRDVVEYMATLEADGQIGTTHEVQEICSYVAKVKGIRDVLLRDHMKVRHPEYFN